MENQQLSPAYFRRDNNNTQCHLSFHLKITIPPFGTFEDNIRSVRDQSDSVESLLTHTQKKIHKIIRDNTSENLLETEPLPNLQITMRRAEKPLKLETKLKTLFENLHLNINLIFEILGKRYYVVMNAPEVITVKLPSILYSDCSVQSVKFKTSNTALKMSHHFWYKSKDKVDWVKVGNEFRYVTTKEDVGYFLKYVCLPRSQDNIKGPSYEVISEEPVRILGKVPVLAFEKRLLHTKEYLNGSNFRFVTYNILSERYVYNHFEYCPPEFLSTDYRKQIIAQELIGYKADIICLQEVDVRHFIGFFNEAFKRLGYRSFHHKKGNRISEGLVICFRNQRFTSINCRQIVYSEQVENNRMFRHLREFLESCPEVKDIFMSHYSSLQITLLRMEKSKKFLLIGNTHLFYRSDSNHIRLLQVYIALLYLFNLKRTLQKEMKNAQVIFCGDFNTRPTSSCFNFITKGKLSKEELDEFKNVMKSDPSFSLCHPFEFINACGTPTYTNYTSDFKACLDYIFVEEEKISVSNVVPMIEDSELEQYEGLPNEYFPSDHLSLVADLRFTSSE